MNHYCRRISVSVLYMLFLSSCIFRSSAESSEAEAHAVLDNVGALLDKTYLAISEAETAGANITQLKVKINHAGDLLAIAYTRLGTGNSNEAVDFALQANESLEGIDQEVSELTIAAREGGSHRFQWAVLESSIAVSLAVFIVLTGWIYFKKNYVKRVLKMKPEVHRDEP
jgi:hypothetical protein